jgi:hypothetical protein
LVDYQGPARLSIQAAGKRGLQIEVDPRSERQPLTLGVELPGSAQTTWAADVEVLGAKGRPLSVRRSGIEWHKLFFSVPAERGTYVVHVVEPQGARPPVLPEDKRQATDAATGLIASIARWPDGRKAALSIRFDDSHPTHLSKAIPILREYGFRGTFMVNPGRAEPGRRQGSSFQEHRAEWEACARRGDQEFANHSLHHRGAIGDDDMEREIGDASKAIWELFPGKSKLLALNLGGGTQWQTTRTLRYYLDKYHLFDASAGSLGMDDVYGNRLAALRLHVQRHIERGLWCRIHYHAIGERLNASETNFRAAMEVVKEHAAPLWIAGMADIHKYQTERLAAGLEIKPETARRTLLKLSCATDPQLYDQPLTVEVALPPAWSAAQVQVKRGAADQATVPVVPVAGTKAVRFLALPITATYTVEKVL